MHANNKSSQRQARRALCCVLLKDTSATAVKCTMGAAHVHAAHGVSREEKLASA